ncbi:hypothetical protein BJ875DRAFT_478157 [Amylocarpus encephaloides]|uniref:Uncharacterized protein n=1 Tax=Amylocarpus encephaloides TaxID=45428 RepID=A0A9P8BYS7_9HELO|nr:hypothetical protein BJ875DRAFT_478157 [Amylocarpus encephaloides]
MMSTNVVDGRLIQFISEDFSAMCANGRFLFDHDPKAQAALQFVSNQSHHTRSHIRSIVFGKNFLWSIDPHIQDGEHYVIWGEPGDEVYYQHILHQPDWILSSLPELREISFYIPLGHDDTHCSMVLMDFIEHMKYRDFEDRTVEVIRFMFVENLDEAFQPLLCRHLKDPLKLLDCCALEEGCMKNHWGATREVNYHPVVAFEGRAINEEEALSKYGWKHARTVFSIRWVSTSVLLM